MELKTGEIIYSKTHHSEYFWKGKTINFEPGDAFLLYYGMAFGVPLQRTTVAPFEMCYRYRFWSVLDYQNPSEEFKYWVAIHIKSGIPYLLSFIEDKLNLQTEEEMEDSFVSMLRGTGLIEEEDNG